MANYLKIQETNNKCIICDKIIMTTNAHSIKQRESKKLCSNQCKKNYLRDKNLNRFKSF